MFRLRVTLSRRFSVAGRVCATALTHPEPLAGVIALSTHHTEPGMAGDRGQRGQQIEVDLRRTRQGRRCGGAGARVGGVISSFSVVIRLNGMTMRCRIRCASRRSRKLVGGCGTLLPVWIAVQSGWHVERASEAVVDRASLREADLPDYVGWA